MPGEADRYSAGEAPRELDAMGADNFRALTPLIDGHINPYGTFRLNMSERSVIEEAAAT